MKRSVINGHLAEARAFFREHRFELPPWADWTPADWKEKAPNCRAIFEAGLGWDLTDFGSESYGSRGLMLFTIRNGSAAEPGKTYAEKIMIVDENQETPRHYHWEKTEDIINRGGGNLMIELWNSDPAAEERLAETPVTVFTDGLPRILKPGEPLRLSPGESITLTTGLYHRFYGESGKGRVLVGEVSKTNDDKSDNRFHEPVGRFPSIKEDQAPWRLLVGDYPSLPGFKSVPGNPSGSSVSSSSGGAS